MMKIRISLLPAELKKQSSMLKKWTIVALVLIIIAAVFLAGNILFSYYLQTPVVELESLKDQNKSMTENIGRLAYVQEMFDEIENNNRTIEILVGENPDWAYVIELAASNLTLYGIDISRMEITVTGETPGCVITGKTDEVSNIDRWIENVRTRDNLEYINLSNINTSGGTGGKLEFFFTARIGITKWNKE